MSGGIDDAIGLIVHIIDNKLLMCTIRLIVVQVNVYSMCTACVQCVYSICTVFVQYVYSLCTVLLFSKNNNKACGHMRYFQ